jgi:hypothetical protein
MDKLITKAKENKVATVVIVGLVGYGAYKLLNKGSTRQQGSGLSGLPKKKSSTKKQKGKKTTRQYKVRFRGYGPDEDTFKLPMVPSFFFLLVVFFPSQGLGFQH